MNGAEIGLIIMAVMFPIGVVGFFVWLSISAWAETKHIKSYVELDYEEYAQIAEAVIDSTYYGRPIRSVETDDGKFKKLPKGAYGRW